MLKPSLSTSRSQSGNRILCTHNPQMYLKGKLKYHNDISMGALDALKHLWQQLQHQVFFGMTGHALHIWCGGFSAILICKSYQALSGWMGDICGHPFAGLSPEISFKSSVHSFTELLLSLYYLNCALRVIVLGHGTEVLSYKDKFSFFFYYYCSVQLSFIRDTEKLL